MGGVYRMEGQREVSAKEKDSFRQGHLPYREGQGAFIMQLFYLPLWGEAGYVTDYLLDADQKTRLLTDC